jgi:uncharacterized protein (TIGR02588 family)
LAKGRKKDSIPMLEWASAALGLAIAVALMAIIGREAILRQNGSNVPQLSVKVEGVKKTADGHVVQILVFNRSRQTAARVELEGKAGDETSVASIDYVPGRSQAEGGLIFAGDPRQSGLKVRVTGYQLP